MTDILLAAFFISVVLVGIHSFFGLEIIRRGIIFTDLAIGQMAALGAAVSIFFFDGAYIYPTSACFALGGGLMIALAAKRTDTLEAFIGLMYAFGIAGIYIVLSKASHGMETLHKLMASDILFTPMEDIWKTAAIYALIGLFLFFVYRRTTGLLKDVLFFVTFALTVTSSVKLAGVLIVFSLLVSPALIAMKLRAKYPLLWAWIIGTVVNLVAITLSYQYDFPTGYTLVFVHALLALVVTVIVKPAAPKEADNSRAD